VLRFSTVRSNKPSDKACHGRKHLMTLVGGANFRSTRPSSVAEHRQAIYESFSLCYEACRASSPPSFNFHRLSHYPRKLDRV
jgi:hypothetical protein